MGLAFRRKISRWFSRTASRPAENGHGFGLHSGALAAQEMGGSLRAESLGVRRGATFTLELPSRIRFMKTPPASPTTNNRILVIDDNPAIHQRLSQSPQSGRLRFCKGNSTRKKRLFSARRTAIHATSTFQVDSAFQGQEGLEKVRAAVAAGAPYAVAFVDVRMPPGWDGVETITRIWAEFRDLQIVICTAYSDYSWDEISKAIGNTDHVLVLKKPFDNIEVLQMAHALSKKWELTQMAARQMEELDALVNQRTTELREANARLTDEVAERVAAEDALRRSEERFSKAFHGSPVPMVIQRPDGSDCLDANASFLDLVGATREAVLAGRGAVVERSHDRQRAPRRTRWATPSAGSRLAFARLPATCARCSSRRRIWRSAALPTISLSFRTSPIACVSKMNFARRKRWKPSVASLPASLTTSTTCSPSSSDTRR